MTNALTGMSGSVVPAPLPLMFVHVTVPAPVIVARQTWERGAAGVPKPEMTTMSVDGDPGTAARSLTYAPPGNGAAWMAVAVHEAPLFVSRYT